MQNEINTEVKNYLTTCFNNIKLRHTEKGFRFNVQKLDKYDLMALDLLPCTNNIEIKRSGTGLVVIIE